MKWHAWWIEGKLIMISSLFAAQGPICKWHLALIMKRFNFAAKACSIHTRRLDFNNSHQGQSGGCALLSKGHISVGATKLTVFSKRLFYIHKTPCKHTMQPQIVEFWFSSPTTLNLLCGTWKVWWHLCNFLVRQVKFNRFLHPNE